jgi:hypothetical protein
VVSGNTSVERVTIEHLTIRSGKTFAAVRAALEALVPRLDDGFWTLLRFGLTDRARQELEAAATLWRMSCRKPRTGSTKAAPSRYREGPLSQGL